MKVIAFDWTGTHLQPESVEEEQALDTVLYATLAAWIADGLDSIDCPVCYENGVYHFMRD